MFSTATWLDQFDGTIEVEWVTEGETWVDFAYPFGLSEFGTFLFPFNTFVEGRTAVPAGGTLWFKTGTSPETASVIPAVDFRRTDFFLKGATPWTE